MSSLTSSVIIFTVEGKPSEIVRGGIVEGVFFFPIMKNTQHWNCYCLLPSVQNHSATSVRKVAVQILDRKWMRFGRPRLLAIFFFVCVYVLGKVTWWLVFTTNLVKFILFSPAQLDKGWLHWSVALELPTVMPSMSYSSSQCCNFEYL